MRRLWMDFLNFSVCWRWKIEPGSWTWSMLKTLNWPPNTFSLIGSLAFKYSSRETKLVSAQLLECCNGELTSEIYSRRGEGSHDEYGHSDTETPLLVGVDLGWFPHLGKPGVWWGLRRTDWVSSPWYRSQWWRRNGWTEARQWPGTRCGCTKIFVIF